MPATLPQWPVSRSHDDLQMEQDCGSHGPVPRNRMEWRLEINKGSRAALKALQH